MKEKGKEVGRARGATHTVRSQTLKKCTKKEKSKEEKRDKLLDQKKLPWGPKRGKAH